MRFAGYAAIFGTVDRGGDMVMPGAFAESLKRRGGGGNAGDVPLLWNHAAGQVIGAVEYVREDSRGLRVIGRIRGGSGAAARAREMLGEGQVNGLSFGYRVLAAEGRAPRKLHALDLVEVSIVPFPMQPMARVHRVEGGGLLP